MKIETIVRDPGDKGEKWPWLMGECYQSAIQNFSMPTNHAWQIISINDKGSIWVCSTCKRIEERIVVENE